MNKDVLAAVLAEICACEAALRAHSVPTRHVPDLVQQGRIAAWRALERGALVQGPVSLRAGRLEDGQRQGVRAWLWRVGARLACSYHAHCDRRRYGAREEPRDPNDAVRLRESLGEMIPSAEDLALAREVELQLDEALAELERTAPNQHAVVTRYAPGECDIQDIAADLGIPSNTVWTRLHLGREAVRASFRRAEAQARGQLARRVFVDKHVRAPS